MLIATDRPIVIFDTSAVNAIYDDSARDNRMNQLLNIYSPRLTFAVLDEILATANNENNQLLDYRRKQLFEITLRLQNAGDCLLPFHYLLINHVKAFVCDERYDWTIVNCCGNKLKETIVEQRHGLSDQLVQEQRKQNLDLEKQYKLKFTDIRGQILADENWKDRFHSLDNFIHFAFGDNGPYWIEAASHVKKALQISVEEEESQNPNDVPIIRKLKDAENRITVSDVKQFVDVSPPFKAHIYGIAYTAYSRIHDPSLNSKQRASSAGRVDTFMTLYLPYCRYFVTNDNGQFDCHKKVASKLGNVTDVFMYEDFWKSLPYH